MQNKIVKKFLIKLVFFLGGALIIFHICFGYVLPYMVINSGDTKILRWINFYSTPINAEAVILGSSRAHRGINPEILSNELGYYFHNMAFQGMSLSNYSRFLSDYLLNNKSPRFVIISLDILALSFRDRIAGDYYLIPAMNNESKLLNEIYQFRYIKYFKDYGYFYYKNDFFSIVENPNKQPYFGFEPIDQIWTTHHINKDIQQDETYFSEEKQYSKIDRTNSELYFNNLSKIVEENNIDQLFIILSPYFCETWNKVENKTELINYVDSISRKYNFININYLESPISKKQSNFYDPIHLNKNGAEAFSMAIADSLKKIIEETKYDNGSFQY